MEPESLSFCSYAAFGEEFFAQAATQERIVGAVDMLAGQPLDFGPLGVGPGRLVQVTAHGTIGPSSSSSVQGPYIGHRVILPVTLDLEIDLGVDVHRFGARLAVPLVLTARAAAGLVIYLEVTPPRPQDIALDISARGLRASVLQRVAGVDGEVRRFVAKYVAREIEKPYVRAARTIDVASAIDAAWARLAPKGPTVSAASLVTDLPVVLDSERWDQG